MDKYCLINNEHIKSEYGEISNSLVEIKKSKFYGYIFNIKSKNQALDYIKKIKIKNKDAKHVVFIYSYTDELNRIQIDFSEDGEPQGTATRAIYELLEKESITNVCIVIVRYFGGILLGAGPLSRAYLNTARAAIKLCKKQEIYIYIRKIISSTYNNYQLIISRLEKYIDSKMVIIKKTDFNENVQIDLDIEENEYNYIIDEIKEYI